MTVAKLIRKILKNNWSKSVDLARPLQQLFSSVKSHFEWAVTRCEKGEKREDAGGPGSARSVGTFVSKIEEKVLLLLRGKMRKAREGVEEVDGVKKS